MVYPSETISANVRTIFQLDTRSLSVGFCRYQHTHIKWRTMSVPTREIQWMESGKNPMGRHDIDKNCDRKYSLWAENGMLLFVQNPMQSADDDKTENHGFAFNCFNFSCLWVEIRNWISTHRIPFYWVDFFLDIIILVHESQFPSCEPRTEIVCVCYFAPFLNIRISIKSCLWHIDVITSIRIHTFSPFLHFSLARFCSYVIH